MAQFDSTVDYSVMDTFVYVENGEFMDGYVVSLFHDRVKKSDYAQFLARMPMVICDLHSEFFKEELLRGGLPPKGCPGPLV